MRLLFLHSIFLIALIVICGKTNAQENYRAGTLTQLNINSSINKQYKFNIKLEARQIFSEKETEKPRQNKFRYERTDMHLVVTRKLSSDNTIGAGYLLRLEDGKFAHRFIQQFNNVRKFETFTLAHRIVLDETFRRDEPTDIRLRYRASIEKALNGRSVDPKEFYLKLNNEYLGIWSNPNADLEIRGSLALGYNATDQNKVELGLEYRTNEFYEDVQAQQFWVTVAWYVSL